MAQPKPSKHPNDKIAVEPGADKRLANILKKALNTPPKRQPVHDASGQKSKPAK